MDAIIGTRVRGEKVRGRGLGIIVWGIGVKG
jgi:hypothetical protein